MEAVLYAASSGSLILVPDCFKPPRDLEHAQGRFRVCGRISVQNVDTPLWRRILVDFEGCGYAALAPCDADRLFGAEALWGIQRPQGRASRNEVVVRTGEAEGGPLDPGRRR